MCALLFIFDKYNLRYKLIQNQHGRRYTICFRIMIFLSLSFTVDIMNQRSLFETVTCIFWVVWLLWSNCVIDDRAAEVKSQYCRFPFYITNATDHCKMYFKLSIRRFTILQSELLILLEHTRFEWSAVFSGFYVASVYL